MVARGLQSCRAMDYRWLRRHEFEQRLQFQVKQVFRGHGILICQLGEASGESSDTVENKAHVYNNHPKPACR